MGRKLPERNSAPVSDCKFVPDEIDSFHITIVCKLPRLPRHCDVVRYVQLRTLQNDVQALEKNLSGVAVSSLPANAGEAQLKYENDRLKIALAQR